MNAVARLPRHIRRAALGGIGFTMSLFIAGVAFPERTDYEAAKIAIFLASLTAGGLGMLILGSVRNGGNSTN